MGPDAALLVMFLARAVVQLLLANPEAMAEGLLPVPLATRAADSTSGLDFRRNNVVAAAAAAAAAVGSALGNTEESISGFTEFNGSTFRCACFSVRNDCKKSLEN